MNIGFHSNQLGIRGTEVALYDYAFYNETILGNKSFIISDKNKDLWTLDKFIKIFDVFLYDKFSDVEDYVKSNNIEVTYFIKAGDIDGKILNSCKNAIHAVFPYNQPHGDSYMYVSEWLSLLMTKNDQNYVPHIIKLPDVDFNYREALNIPDDALVFGRHGGYKQFDIDWVKEEVCKFARNNSNVYFLFLNTEPFSYDLPNIIYLEPEYDINRKTAFINTCDAMIHARQEGETFGLAVGEFLHQNKPIISYKGGRDLNHLYLLKDKGLTYSNQSELREILNNFHSLTYGKFYKDLISEFAPENVMNIFKNRFLK